MTRYGTIIGTGRYRPGDLYLSNETCSRSRSAEQPRPGQGGRRFPGQLRHPRRRLAPSEWAASDIAVRAAQAALDKAGITPEQVDMILLGTDTPDYITPATSTVVQHKLGAVNAGTYDIGCACASFPTGIATALRSVGH